MTDIDLIFDSENTPGAYAVVASVHDYGDGSVTFADSGGQEIWVSGKNLDKIEIVRKAVRS